jgi:predicted porin
MDNKRNLVIINLVTFAILLAIIFPVSSIAADDEFKFYGAFKLSLNAIDDGTDSNLTVSNNDSRMGIKGSHKLPENLSLIYQFEMEIDSTERNGFSSGRNSFVGAEGSFGKFMLGQHDTPLKKIRSHGAELFDDTIAGSRSIISAISGTTGAKLDDRAKNAVIYFSPRVNDTQLFALYSTDMDPGDEVVDNNDNDLTSVNVVHVNGPLYVGVGYEKKSQPLATDDITATRIGFSYKFGTYQVGGIVESADAGNNNPLSRDAVEVNVRYNMNAKTWAGLQVAQAKDYDGSSDTGATNISVGVVHSLDKSTKVYVVASSTSNDNNAQFGLAQGGNQDKVIAVVPGDTVTGISTGVEYKF